MLRLLSIGTFIAHLFGGFQAWASRIQGSVSQSYDGDTRASYLVIDGEELQIRRVEYDVQSEAEDLLRSDLPHAGWMARILLAGKYCPPDE